MRTKMQAALGAVMIAIATLFAAAPAFPLSLSEILGNGPRQDFSTFKIIRVADLKALTDDAKHPIHLYDANDPDTRAHFGVIPGATLLSSYDNYDLATLPSDKDAKLVFYCADTH